jgi:hypothetical protein
MPFEKLISGTVLVWTLSIFAGCVAAEDPLPVVDGAKRVFASSVLVTGNLGGLTGADALCGTWAQAADLSGSWKAFLSATGTNATSRINEVGPWYNVNRQEKIFNNKTGFTVGALDAIRTEYGASASGDAWTGTKSDGTVNGTNHCGNWTSGTAASYASVGTPGSTVEDGVLWMAKGGNIPACNNTKRVYCFEQ